jgi:hypothetical protein
MVDTHSHMREYSMDAHLNRHFEVVLSPENVPTEVVLDVCAIGRCWDKDKEDGRSPADRLFISPRGVVIPTCFDCLNKTRLHRTDRKFSNAATSMSFDEFSEIFSKSLQEGSEKVKVVSYLGEEPWVRGVKKKGEYFVLTGDHIINTFTVVIISMILFGLFIHFVF